MADEAAPAFIYTTGVALIAFKRYCKDADMVITDSPVLFSILLRCCQRHDIPILAAPHNIEAFNGNYFRNNAIIRGLHRELEHLCQYNGIITIAFEERWMMANIGVPVITLLPEPSAQNRQWLEQIRTRRSSIQTFNKVLLIGRADVNIPTQAGMKAVIETWQGSAMLHERFGPLLVAGYDTESFQLLCDGTRCIYLGAIDQAQYETVLSEVAALICYQESGAGALTRIASHLYAGVPIVSNLHAARSYYPMPGIHLFDNLDHDSLMQALEEATTAPIPPKPPCQFDSNSRKLADFINRFIH